MTVNATDKLKTVLEIYGIIHHLPGWRHAIKILINPMDSTRYIEFAHLLQFLDKSGVRPQRILDVSSPYILSYVLSKTGKVIKTDINPGEGKFIREGENLSFRPEDAAEFPRRRFLRPRVFDQRDRTRPQELPDGCPRDG